MTHTPGPWRIFDTMHKEGSNESLQDGLPDPARINILAGQKANRWGICSLMSFNPTTEREQHLANARLIAAAPELLEALTALVNEHFAPVYAPGNVRTQQWERARAAIAKAEGR